MERETIVNKTVRDLNTFGLINSEEEGFVRILLNLLSVAVEEQTKKALLAHHKQKVVQYNKDGKEIARYNSINEAALAMHVCRDTIDKSVCGNVPFTRKGKYYFRYADESIM